MFLSHPPTKVPRTQRSVSIERSFHSPAPAGMTAHNPLGSPPHPSSPNAFHVCAEESVTSAGIGSSLAWVIENGEVVHWWACAAATQKPNSFRFTDAKQGGVWAFQRNADTLMIITEEGACEVWDTDGILKQSLSEAIPLHGAGGGQPGEAVSTGEAIDGAILIGTSIGRLFLLDMSNLRVTLLAQSGPSGGSTWWNPVSWMGRGKAPQAFPITHIHRAAASDAVVACSTNGSILVVNLETRQIDATVNITGLFNDCATPIATTVGRSSEDIGPTIHVLCTLHSGGLGVVSLEQDHNPRTLTKIPDTDAFNDIHYWALHVVNGSFEVVTSHWITIATPSVDVKTPQSANEKLLRRHTVASIMVQDTQTVVLLTTAGMEMRRGVNHDVHVAMNTLQNAPKSSVNDDVSAVSKNIAEQANYNPTNWAKDNLEVEDKNVINHLLVNLNQKRDRHDTFVGLLRTSTQWRALSEATVGELLGRQERLSIMVSLRELQNDVSDNSNTERAFFKQCIHAVVSARSQCDEAVASSAEKFYHSPDNVPYLLAEMANRAVNLMHAGLSLSETLAVLSITVTAFSRVLDTVEAGRQHARDALRVVVSDGHRWTNDTTMGTAITHELHAVSDGLAALIDANTFDLSVEQSDTEWCTLLTTFQDRLIRFLLDEHLLRDASDTYNLVTRAFLRTPFALTPVGYPHGEIETGTRHAVGMTMINTAQELCISARCFEGLYLFFGDRITDPSLAVANRLREWSEALPDFLPFVVRAMVQDGRVKEIMSLHTTLYPDNHAGRQAAFDTIGDVLAADAPHLHWLFDPTAIASMVSDGQRQLGPTLGVSATEHRKHKLDTAVLALHAGHGDKETVNLVESHLICSDAQLQYLGDSHANVLLSHSDLSSTLCLMSDASAFESAALVAERIADRDPRHQCLHGVLKKAMDADASVLDRVVNDASLTEKEKERLLESSTAARVLNASESLTKWVSAMTDFSADFGGISGAHLRVLKQWINFVQDNRPQYM